MSKIEWTDETWNCIRGCTVLSKGCTNCYAMKQARRFSGEGMPYEGLTKLTNGGPVWTGEVRLVPELLEQPLRWRKPRRIFVNSMSDLFHEDVPFEFIASVFAIMGVTTRHTYQILTKRPERMLEFFEWALQAQDDDGTWYRLCGPDEIYTGGRIFDHWPKHIEWYGANQNRGSGYDNCGPLFPYENVWLGTSIEDQPTADERISLLLQAPAAVYFVSYEPALASVDFRPYMPNELWNDVPGWNENPNLDWIIAGSESGPRARAAEWSWFRSVKDQCVAAGVPFFFKQWVERGRKESLPELDGQMWNQFPGETP